MALFVSFLRTELTEYLYLKVALFGTTRHFSTNIHCKKSVDFKVKYLQPAASRFPVIFYRRLLVEHFKKSRYGRVMLTDNTRKYLCRVYGLYDQKQYMSYCYSTVPGFLKCLRAPIKNGKWTGSWWPVILP